MSEYWLEEHAIKRNTYIIYPFQSQRPLALNTHDYKCCSVVHQWHTFYLLTHAKDSIQNRVNRVYVVISLAVKTCGEFC